MDSEMETYLSKMQIKETSDLYLRCTTNCFDHCVNNFTTRKINDKETSCIQNCTEKFAKVNQRLTMRLLEWNQEGVQRAAQEMGQK